MPENLLPHNSCDDRNAHGRAYTCEEVLSEIEKQQSGRKNWITNMLILLISLFIFFKLGLLKSGVYDLIIIVIVLLIHEAGHLVAMRLFGYKNVQMFFIPLLGAAVAGQSQNVPTYKKAIVTLLGPVPGIFLGIVFAIIYAITRTPIYRQLMIMFTIINTFNLLPFFPLDGGRLLHQVLFSRNRYIELCFGLLAALALIAVGVLIQAWLLAIFGLFSLISARFPFKIARIASDLKPSLSPPDTDHSQTPPHKTTNADAIPPEIAKDIIEKIHQHFPARLTVKVVASYTRQVWERMHLRPPGILATSTLLGVYLLCFFFSFAATLGAAAFSMAEKGALTQTKIVEYQKPNGQTARKEQVYFLDTLTSENDLAADRLLYHGASVSYYPDGTIFKEGTWHQGKWHGEWKEYNTHGKLVRVTIFDKGKFVVRKEWQDGRWVEKALEDLPSSLQRVLRQHAEGPPHGPQPPQNTSHPAETQETNAPPKKP